MITCFEEYIVNPSTSILEAMRSLESKSHTCLFVADSDNHLLATLSDGDIRRHILSGGAFTDACTLAARSDFLYTHPGDFKKVLSDARRRDVDIVPVLSLQNQLLGFLEAEKRSRFYDNTVVLIAGGKGTRLMPLTKDIPKPLLAIGNKPIIHRIIDFYIGQGFQNFVLSLGHFSDQIIDYIEHHDFPANIQFIVEDRPLGTAGSLSKLSSLSDIHYPLVVSNADILYDEPIYTHVDYLESTDTAGIMLHVPKSHSIDYGVIDIGDDHSWNSITEKPISTVCINSCSISSW